MEKFVYMIGSSEQVSLDHLTQKLLSSTVTELREHGASRITINIADMNEEIINLLLPVLNENTPDFYKKYFND